jgi:hypothetical protein
MDYTPELAYNKLDIFIYNLIALLVNVTRCGPAKIDLYAVCT